jgi:hypothetical protein
VSELVGVPTNDPSVTDWIAAIATVFAAIGTVGAVAVALWQSARREKRRLITECRLGIVLMNDQPIDILTLRGTLDSFRPVTVTGAYLRTDDGRQVVAPRRIFSDNLPKKLHEDGEVTIELTWETSALDDLKAKEGFRHYLFAYFTDSANGVYPAAFPGVKHKRKGLPWKRRDHWQPK